MKIDNKFTALDYIRWRGDLGFDTVLFNEIDLFLMSQLVTPDFTGIVPVYEPGITLGEAASKYFESHDLDVKNLGVLQSTSVLPALLEMSKSVRYKDLTLCGFSNYVDTAIDEQFCGLVIGFPMGLKVVTFRGTDDTIVGWKEDCNIAAQDIVPAQQDALDYLIYVAEHTERADLEGLGDIFVTGHSKGGNLAVYAACMAPKHVRDRIGFVVNWDGPGFRQQFLDSEGYKELNDRNCIFNVLSQNSLVGTLLDPAGERVFVNSFIDGPLAHDGFYWEATKDYFARVDGLSQFSAFMEVALKDTLVNMDSEQRQKFINELFDALSSSGALTLSELNEQGMKGVRSVLGNVRTSPEVRSFIKRLISNSFRLLKSDSPASPLAGKGIKFF